MPPSRDFLWRKLTRDDVIGDYFRKVPRCVYTRQLIYTRRESYRVIIKRHDKIYNNTWSVCESWNILSEADRIFFLYFLRQKIFTQRTLLPRNWTGTCLEADRIFEFISPLNGFYPTRGIFQNEFAILSRESVCERRHSVINNRQAGARCQN